jgi:hypothetical protein
MERDFQADVPHFAPEVAAMQNQQSLAGEPAQPEECGHRRVSQVFPRTPDHIDACLLEHIRRVEPPLEPAVEPEPDHSLEPLAMAREELQECGLVAALDPVLQLDQSAGLAGHDPFPSRITARTQGLSTAEKSLQDLFRFRTGSA